MACKVRPGRSFAKQLGLLMSIGVVTSACAQESTVDPGVRQIERGQVVEAPDPAESNSDDFDPEVARHGKYMVELLGCAACHTDGALAGTPKRDFLLAGSIVGIALESPMDFRRPAVIYPPNLTPDAETGLGRWQISEIAAAIRGGIDRHGKVMHPAMPSSGYARLSHSDATAIATYLKSIPAVDHAIPADVSHGEMAKFPYVFFGVYETTDE